MKTSIIHDTKGQTITPANVATMAREMPVAVNFINFGKFDADIWAKYLTTLSSMFVTYDETGENPQIVLYTGDRFKPTEIIADIGRKDIVAIHSSVPVRLPIGNVATISLLGQEIRTTRPEIVALTTLFGYISPSPVASYDLIAEAKAHITMHGTTKMVNLPDVEGIKRIGIDAASGALYALTNTGYIPGMITADGTVKWGTVNTPLSVELIEGVFETYVAAVSDTRDTHTS